MRICAAITRRVKCTRYSRCLDRAAAVDEIFSCSCCKLFSPEHITPKQQVTESLRAARLLLEVWPELSTADPADHELFNISFPLPAFPAEAKAALQKAFSITASTGLENS